MRTKLDENRAAFLADLPVPHPGITPGDLGQLQEEFDGTATGQRELSAAIDGANREQQAVLKLRKDAARALYVRKRGLLKAAAVAGSGEATRAGARRSARSGPVKTATSTGASPAGEARSEHDVALETAETGTYFHGTSAILQPGDVLVPGAGLNKRNFGTSFGVNGGGNEHVYLTSGSVSAFDWGQMALGSRRKKSVRVYQVEARAVPTSRDDEFVAHEAVVVRDVTNG